MSSGDIVERATFIHRTDYVSFHCVKCGMRLSTRPRSSSVDASRTVCLQCGEPYWIYWNEEQVKRGRQS